ncbi:MAG TPA: cation:proton antiporter [Acidilobales archaeon]|nr:cation:proton antiporter [Acidilobales archaeon]
MYPLTDVVEGFSWFGILMLLLYAGLETRYREFMRLAPIAGVITLGEALSAFAMGYITGFIFGYNPLQCFFLGAILEATSISVSVRTLVEIDKLTTIEGRSILGVAVFDDITALITIVAGTSLISIGKLEPITLVKTAGTAFGYWLILVIVLHRLSNYFTKLVLRLKTSEALLASIVALFSIAALLASYIGLSPLIAAYAVGLALSEARGISRAIDKVRALAMIFSTLFFITTAAHLDLKQALRPELILFYIVFVVAAFAGKLLGGGLTSFILGYPARSSLRLAIGLFPRAEFAIVAAYIATKYGLLGPEAYLGALMIVLITNIVTPPLLKIAFRGPEVYSVKVKLFPGRRYL